MQVRTTCARCGSTETYKIDPSHHLDPWVGCWVCFDCKNGNQSQFEPVEHKGRDEIRCKLCGSFNTGEPDWHAGTETDGQKY